MDFSSILTTLWGKVTQPLPNIFVGIALIVFAPENIQFAGYIFIALGSAEICKRVYPYCIKAFTKFCLIRRIKGLSGAERSFLNKLRKIGVRNVMNDRPVKKEDMEELSYLSSLETKKLVEHQACNGPGGTYSSYYVTDKVVEALKDILEKEAR